MTAKPYHVYYRHSRGKGFKAFKTRDQQVRFIINAPHTFAITSYN